MRLITRQHYMAVLWVAKPGKVRSLTHWHFLGGCFMLIIGTGYVSLTVNGQ
jgi:hypothetical protein